MGFLSYDQVLSLDRNDPLNYKEIESSLLTFPIPTSFQPHGITINLR